MSATGRSDVRDPNDFYGTPAWAVRRYLDHRSLALPGGRVLEPSAGKGAIIRACRDWLAGHGCDDFRWMAVELIHSDELLLTGVPCFFGSFLDPKVSVDKKFDLCIGNPPYKHAQEFIEKALQLSHEVAFLLRLNFLESEERYEFFKKHPCDVRVLPNRPSFYVDGHTDATAYAWFEFGLGHGGHLSVLGLTPKDERRRDRG